MKQVITAFKEHKEFKRKKYWDANDLSFKMPADTPPHYADTVEILVNCGATGDMYIGGSHFTLDGNQVFFIPPGSVHAMRYKKSDGVMTVLKINLPALGEVIDIEKLLCDSDHPFDSLPFAVKNFDAAQRLNDAFRHSDDLLFVLSQILSFFSVLIDESKQDADTPRARYVLSDNMSTLIDWTEQNFTQKIDLTQAASILGYNKNYFCKKFKASTGVTYINYLNCLRIEHACTQLKKGLSVAEVCYSCGFENPSYFIKLFRSTVGVTPMKYVASHSQLQSNR